MAWHLQAELGKPSILHPDKGKVAIFVDCSPTAEPLFEVGDLLWLDRMKITSSLILLLMFIIYPMFGTVVWTLLLYAYLISFIWNFLG